MSRRIRATLLAALASIAIVSGVAGCSPTDDPATTKPPSNHQLKQVSEDVRRTIEKGERVRFEKIGSADPASAQAAWKRCGRWRKYNPSITYDYETTPFHIGFVVTVAKSESLGCSLGLDWTSNSQWKMSSSIGTAPAEEPDATPSS